MISSKRRKLEWLLDNRPAVHPVIISVSSITGEVCMDFLHTSEKLF